MVCCVRRKQFHALCHVFCRVYRVTSLNSSNPPTRNKFHYHMSFCAVNYIDKITKYVKVAYSKDSPTNTGETLVCRWHFWRQLEALQRSRFMVAYYCIGFPSVNQSADGLCSSNNWRKLSVSSSNNGNCKQLTRRPHRGALRCACSELLWSVDSICAETYRPTENV